MSGYTGKFTAATNRDLFEEHTRRMMGLDERRRLEDVQVNTIALRRESKFIINEEMQKPLIKSISKNGLIAPILVCSIKNYLVANHCIPEDYFLSMKEKIKLGKKYISRTIAYLNETGAEKIEEVPDAIIGEDFKDDRKERAREVLKPIVADNTLKQLNKKMDLINEYEKKYEEGFLYFVVAGNRRFKAYLSLLTGESVVANSDWERLYYEKLKKPSDELKNSKWFTIPAYVLTSNDVSAEAVEKMYRDSNMTQIKPTAFE